MGSLALSERCSAVDGLTKDNPKPSTLHPKNAYLHAMVGPDELREANGNYAMAVEISKVKLAVWRSTKKGDIMRLVGDYRTLRAEGKQQEADAAMDRAHFIWGEITHTPLDAKSKPHGPYQVYDPNVVLMAMYPSTFIGEAASMLIHRLEEDDEDEIPVEVWTESRPELRGEYQELFGDSVRDPVHPSMEAARPRP